MEVKIIGQMDNTIDHTFESANRVYDKNQLCPTIPTCGGGNIQPKVIEETRCVGGLSDMKWGTQYHQQDRVYKGDIALAQPANLPEGSYKYVMEELYIKQITKNQFYEQAIQTAIEGNAEPGDVIDAFNKKVLKNGISPTITTRPEGKKTAILPCVEIKQATKEGTIKCKVGGCYDASFPGSATRRGRVQEGGDVAPTLTAGSNENIRYVETIYRIRKLTPRECWRLMGYTDTDFDNAEKVNSNTQLYKQAGNAIVKQVLMAIFAQMIPESARQK